MKNFITIILLSSFSLIAQIQYTGSIEFGGTNIDGLVLEYVDIKPNGDFRYINNYGFTINSSHGIFINKNLFAKMGANFLVKNPMLDIFSEVGYLFLEDRKIQPMTGYRVGLRKYKNPGLEEEKTLSNSLFIGVNRNIYKSLKLHTKMVFSIVGCYEVGVFGGISF